MRAVIRCLIRLDAVGCLEGFEASGHALSAKADRDGGQGVDLACAAVTILLRTAGRLLHRHPGLRTAGGAPRGGEMLLEVGAVPDDARGWLQGATDFLLTGLRDIQSEYPQSLEIVIRRKGTTDHGT